MYDSEVEVFRDQVKSFLKANLSDDWQGIGTLPADEAQAWVTEWRKILYHQRYLAPGWPAMYGGGGRLSVRLGIAGVVPRRFRSFARS